MKMLILALLIVGMVLMGADQVLYTSPNVGAMSTMGKVGLGLFLAGLFSPLVLFTIGLFNRND